MTHFHQQQAAFPASLLQCESSNKDRGSFKGVKGGQAAEGRKKKKREGGGGFGLASQEKFNKTISDGGRGPRQSAGEALQLIFVLDPTPSPVLLTVPHKYLKCGCRNNAEAPEMESRANRGWMAPMFVQSLNKATLQVPLKANQTNRSRLKARTETATESGVDHFLSPSSSSSSLSSSPGKCLLSAICCSRLPFTSECCEAMYVEI